MYIVHCTGLSTKDETSETAVRTLWCLFSYIHDCKLDFLFGKSLDKPIKD